MRLKDHYETQDHDLTVGTIENLLKWGPMLIAKAVFFFFLQKLFFTVDKMLSAS